MASDSFAKYLEAEALARVLRETAKDARLRPMETSVKQKYYQASLAAYVAGWDNYVKSVVREYLRRVADPLDQKYSAMHRVVVDLAELVLSRLNTPNRDNARNAILQCTGYDPFSDWIWKRSGMNATNVKDLLDDIFKLRHSFAHGFPLPNVALVITPTGKRQINDAVLIRVEKLLRHLASVTDSRLSVFAKTFRSGPPIW